MFKLFLFGMVSGLVWAGFATILGQLNNMMGFYHFSDFSLSLLNPTAVYLSEPKFILCCCITGVLISFLFYNPRLEDGFTVFLRSIFALIIIFIIAILLLSINNINILFYSFFMVPIILVKLYISIPLVSFSYFNMNLLNKLE